MLSVRRVVDLVGVGRLGFSGPCYRFSGLVRGGIRGVFDRLAVGRNSGP